MDLGTLVIERALRLPPRRVDDISTERDLRISMPDGVVLLADRHWPSSQSGASPVVLVRSPYGRRGVFGALFGKAFAHRGFQVVVQSVRGTFGSGGEFDAMLQEQADGLATAEWVRAQPWCDGRLAMIGLSYLGYTQWAIAPYLDPPLDAMGLGVTASEFMSTHYPGGTFTLHGSLSWTVLTTVQEHALLGGNLPNPVRDRRTRKAMSYLPLRDADLAAAGREVRYWRNVTTHAEPGDDFWAPTDHSGSLGKMTTPGTMLTGWYDVFLPWQLRDFQALSEAGCPTRITIGPWAHADPPGVAAAVRDQLAWLDTHLNGVELADRAPVRVILQHGDRWLDFDQWPPAESTPTPLYLQPAGGLGYQPPPVSEPDEFTYDPADPTPTIGGPLLTGKTKQHDNRRIEARPDVLVFTTAPLEHDVDLVGEVQADVHVGVDIGHGDVFVRLCDVHPNGASYNVTDGIRRLRPADPEAVTVAMWPTGYRFRRGHRIRVYVAGGAFPRFARNPGTGEKVADAVGLRPARVTVHHDPDRPSRVILPLLSQQR